METKKKIIWILALFPFLVCSQVRINGNSEIRVLEDGAIRVTGDTEVASGASLSILGDYSVSSNLVNNGLASNIIIESISTQTGSLIVGGSSIGNIRVERYLSPATWHYLAPAVNGVNTGDFFFNHNPDVWASFYNESLGIWEYLDGLTDAMPIGTGYKMWIADTKTAVTAEMEGSLRTTDLSVTLTTNGAGWNLIGNPFTSEINTNEGAWGNNTSGSFYVWDSTYNGGDYRVWNAINGDLTDGIIPISQSFLVYAEGAGSYKIPKASQTHGGDEFYKKKPENPYLRLQLNYKEYGNTMFVGFSDFGTPHIDKPGDAYKLYAGSDVPQMYMMEDGHKLCMKLDQPLTNNAREVDLYLDQVADGDYYLTIDNLAKLSGTDVLVKDLKTGVEHDFSLNPIFHFQANTGDELLRLRLFFSKKSFGVEETKRVDDLLQIYCHDRNLFISSVGEAIGESGELIIYDLYGRVLHKQYVSSGAEVKIPIHLRDMILFAKVQKRSSQKVKKISLF